MHPKPARLGEKETLTELAIRRSAQVPRGRLRLTVPPTFGTLDLTPALNDFAQLYPEVDLDVRFSDETVSLMAVRIGRTEDSNLIARRLCDMRIILLGVDGESDPAWLQPGRHRPARRCMAGRGPAITTG